MYEDRGLESFASDRACLELSKQCFKTSTDHRGQEIELKSRVSLSRKAQGGQTSSKKEMKIHLICEHFRNRVKFGLPAPYLYFVFENHRD